MAKNIYTPRDELVCGKLDYLIGMVKEGRGIEAIYLINDIRHDVTRMEQKLISRKQEAQKAGLE